jgi:tRNA(fMet)-specific endonuclease VapC
MPFDLIADTNVLSYMFRRSYLGQEYLDLVGNSSIGITGPCIAEIYRGAALGNWGYRKRAEMAEFLGRFGYVPEMPVIAELCGNLHARREIIGRRMEWPDAWAAASALWYDVPLVTHDRDLEAIPGLRIVTAHQGWRIAEPNSVYGDVGAANWLADDAHTTRLWTSARLLPVQAT